MKKFILTIPMLLLVGLIYSQKTNLPGKLPWVNGNLPANSINFNYKVVSGEGVSLTEAQNEAVRELVVDLSAEKGVTISSETLLKTQTLENDNNQSFSADYSRETKIEQEGFEVVFTRVDEYYEVNDGVFKTWRLYVINASSNSIPKINYTNSYSFSEAGFKSLIVPGWGQFHKKQNTKGVLFMLAGIGSLGSFLNANNQYNYNMNRSEETSNLDLRKEFVKKANDFTSIKNISLAAAAVTWIWSTIDATSTKGATKYAYNKPLKLNLASDSRGGLALNLKYKF